MESDTFQFKGGNFWQLEIPNVSSKSCPGIPTLGGGVFLGSDRQLFNQLCLRVCKRRCSQKGLLTSHFLWVIFFLRFLFGFQLERLRFCSRYEKTIRLEELRGVSFENLPLAGKKCWKRKRKLDKLQWSVSFFPPRQPSERSIQRPRKKHIIRIIA